MTDTQDAETFLREHIPSEAPFWSSDEAVECDRMQMLYWMTEFAALRARPTEAGVVERDKLIERLEALVVACEAEFTSELTETAGDPEDGPWREDDDEAVLHGLAEDGHTVIPGNITFGHIRQARVAITALAALQAGEAAPVVEDALRKYVQHLGGCRMRKAMGQACICGLEQALSATPAKPDQTAQGVEQMVALDEEIDAAHPGWMTGGDR